MAERACQTQQVPVGLQYFALGLVQGSHTIPAVDSWLRSTPEGETHIAASSLRPG